jgi:CRISPR/Cas system-associated endonuclease Cas1
MKGSILVVEGYSASLNVERGHLIVRDGFTQQDRREIHFPRGRCDVQRIVIRAPGRTISMEAINWCSHMGIAISFVDSSSRLLNCMIPDVPHDGPVKRAQAVSAVTDDAVTLARYLLGKKMDAQISTMERDFPRLGIGTASGNSASTAKVHACKTALEGTTSLVDFLALEGRAAQIYWDVGAFPHSGALGRDIGADHRETRTRSRCYGSVQCRSQLCVHTAGGGDADRV